VMSTVVLLGAYLSILVQREKLCRQKEVQRLKDVLYVISSDAKEEKIREMATKVLFDETYDIFSDRKRREIIKAQKELLDEFGPEELEDLLKSTDKKE